MNDLTNHQLVIIYLIGWAFSIYIGTRIEAWRLRDEMRFAKEKAYQRGWDNGRDFRDRIVTSKTELESSIRILDPAVAEQMFKNNQQNRNRS